MKFDLKIDEYVKKDQLRMSLKIWDKDLIKSNEFLSEATIDLSKLVFESIESEAPNRVEEPHSDVRRRRRAQGQREVLDPDSREPDPRLCSEGRQHLGIRRHHARRRVASRQQGEEEPRGPRPQRPEPEPVPPSANRPLRVDHQPAVALRSRSSRSTKWSALSSAGSSASTSACASSSSCSSGRCRPSSATS